MGFLNIAIILSILLGFFQVFYAIFRDFLGFWDLVRFWDFSKDFFLFLMKCTKIFRVIYPSIRDVESNCNSANIQLCLPCERINFFTIFLYGKFLRAHL